MALTINTNISSLVAQKNLAKATGSLNQAIKAIIAARGILGSSDFDLVIRPSFQEITIKSEEKTAIDLIIVKVPCGTI